MILCSICGYLGLVISVILNWFWYTRNKSFSYPLERIYAYIFSPLLKSTHVYVLRLSKKHLASSICSLCRTKPAYKKSVCQYVYKHGCWWLKYFLFTSYIYKFFLRHVCWLGKYLDIFLSLSFLSLLKIVVWLNYWNIFLLLCCHFFFFFFLFFQ